MDFITGTCPFCSARARTPRRASARGSRCQCKRSHFPGTPAIHSSIHKLSKSLFSMSYHTMLGINLISNLLLIPTPPDGAAAPTALHDVDEIPLVCPWNKLKGSMLVVRTFQFNIKSITFGLILAESKYIITSQSYFPECKCYPCKTAWPWL